MSRFIYRLAILSALTACLATLGACSKDKKPPTDTGLTQAQADDFAQILAALAMPDSGGWACEAFPAQRHLSYAYATQDTSFTRQSVLWSLDYSYLTPTGIRNATLTDTTVRIECLSRGFGGRRIPDFLGTTGVATYGHISDTLHVEGIAPTDSALIFTGFSTVDSGFVALSNTASTRFYLIDNVIEYDITVSKNPLILYPISGEARVDAFIDVLRSTSRTDRSGLLDATMLITFDGTQTPLATMQANTDQATSVYRYRVDLRTGKIVRAP